MLGCRDVEMVLGLSSESPHRWLKAPSPTIRSLGAGAAGPRRCGCPCSVLLGQPGAGWALGASAPAEAGEGGRPAGTSRQGLRETLGSRWESRAWSGGRRCLGRRCLEQLWGRWLTQLPDLAVLTEEILPWKYPKCGIRNGWEFSLVSCSWCCAPEVFMRPEVFSPSSGYGNLKLDN